MALQFRRGLDADRTSITPLPGEPLWITDTDELYVGDGSTAGGVLITGGGGGGDVATDTIWNAKGDLAVGTGSDTAQRLAVGTNGQFLVAASGQTTGLQWRGITETDLPLTTLTGVIASPEAVTFDTSHSQTPGAAKLQWDDDAGTLSLGLKGGNVNLKIGEMQFVRVKNNTGSQIDAYKVVYITGATGDLPNIALADADSESTAAGTLGFVAENIAASGSGFVIIAGTVKGFNTSGLTLGAPVYLSGTAGGFTTTRPTAPAHGVILGYVAKAAAAPDGIIYVKVDNGYELDELHNVYVNSVADNHFLVYNNGNSRWENESPSDARTSLGLGTAATSNTDAFAAASHTHAAGDITSGTLALARGGTNADLSGTGPGFLKQATSGANVTVAALTSGDLPSHTHAASDITSGALAIANGGTGQTTATAAFDALAPTTTKGDIIVYDGTDNTRLAVGGTNGHVLTVDSSTATGLKWAAASGSGSVASDTIWDAAGDLAVGSGSDTAVRLPRGTAGQVLTVNSGGTDIEWATPTGGGSGGTKTYAVFTPLDAQPPATDFATLDTRNNIAVLEFDGGATDESTTFVGIMPEGASLGSGLKVRIHWMADTATSGDVRWGVAFERMNTDLDSDSFDTVAEGNGTANGTSGIPTVTEITITTIDSTVAGDAFRLKVYREASDTTNDTMSGDAQLIAVEVRSAA
jgi:hypothetical protein